MEQSFVMMFLSSIVAFMHDPSHRVDPLCYLQYKCLGTFDQIKGSLPFSISDSPYYRRSSASSPLSVRLIRISKIPKSITLVRTYILTVHNAHFTVQDFPLHSFSARKSTSGLTPNPNTR